MGNEKRIELVEKLKSGLGQGSTITTYSSPPLASLDEAKKIMARDKMSKSSWINITLGKDVNLSDFLEDYKSDIIKYNASKNQNGYPCSILAELKPNTILYSRDGGKNMGSDLRILKLWCIIYNSIADKEQKR